MPGGPEIGVKPWGTLSVVAAMILRMTMAIVRAMVADTRSQV